MYFDGRPSHVLNGFRLFRKVVNHEERICVKSEIQQIARNATNTTGFRASFKSGLQFTDGTPSRFYFLDEAHDYADLNVGDCVFATGTISISDHGILFMRISGNLERCSG